MSQGFDTRRLFPKTYLRAVDLDGKEVTAQIAEVKNEPLPGEDEAHLVVYFVGKKKTLGLNVSIPLRIFDRMPNTSLVSICQRKCSNRRRSGISTTSSFQPNLPNTSSTLRPLMNLLYRLIP